MMKRILASFLTGIMLIACAVSASAEELTNTVPTPELTGTEIPVEGSLGTYVFSAEEDGAAYSAEQAAEPVTAVIPEAPAVESPAEEQPPVPTSPEASPESSEQTGPGDGPWESGSVRQEVKDENGRTLMTVTVSNVPSNVELLFREATDSEVDEYTGRLGFLAPLYQRAYTTNDFILQVSARISYEDGSTETVGTYVSDEAMTFTVETADLNELWAGRDDEAVRGDHLLYSLPFDSYQRIGYYSLDNEVPAIRFETDIIAPVVLVRLGPGIDLSDAEENMTAAVEESTDREPTEDQTTESTEDQTTESTEDQTAESAEDQTAEPAEDQTAEPAEGQATEPADTDSNADEEPAGLQVKISGLPEGAEATWRELAEEEYAAVLSQIEAAFGGRKVEVVSAMDIRVLESSADTIKTAVVTIPGLGRLNPEARLYGIWDNGHLEYLDFAGEGDTIRFSVYTFSPFILVQPWVEPEEQTEEPVPDQPDVTEAQQTEETEADAAGNSPAAEENVAEQPVQTEPAGTVLRVTGLPEGVSVSWTELGEEQLADVMPAIRAAYSGRQIEVLAAIGIAESEATNTLIKTAEITVPGLQLLSSDARLYRIRGGNSIEFLEFEQSAEQPETVRFSAYYLSPVVLVQPLSVNRLPTVQRELTAWADDGASVVISGLFPEEADARIARVQLTETQLQACIGEDEESGKHFIAYDVKILVGNEVWEPADDQTVSVMITPPGSALNVNTGLSLYRLQSGESGAEAKKMNYDLEDGNAVNFSIGGTKGGAEK